jgi:3alpha(or 20beta)-hydroxysteroid dehydrogenase
VNVFAECALKDKVAIITGAARGQGRAEALRFAELGARVGVADILTDEGSAIAKELGEAGLYLPLDVTSAPAWEAAVAAVVERWGRLDVLVNNAGIFTSAPLTRTSEPDFRRTVDVNQVGVFLGMKAVVRSMKAAGGGSIVNVSSVDGMTGFPGAVAYVASKFAVRGMTKVAALELAPLGIRVNSIHPGAVDTPMLDDPAFAAAGAIDQIVPKIPLARLASAGEVAELVVFLASDASSYCTGSEFVIDGGLTAGIVFGSGR